jgi:hypothetical protein
VFQKPGYLSAVRALPNQESGAVELGTIELTPLVAVRVRVVDRASGAALAGARAWLVVAPEALASRRADERFDDSGGVLTDPRGEARLGAAPGVACRVFAEAPGYARSRGIDVAPRGDEPVLVELGRGGSLVVSVVDANRTAVGGREVEIRFERDDGEEGGDGPSSKATTDGAGEARFDPLTPGTWLAAVTQVDPFGGTRALGARGLVRVEEGVEARLELEVPVLGSIVGRVRENGRPLVGASVWVDPKMEGEDDVDVLLPGMTPQSTADSEGLFRIDGLDAGLWHVVVEHPTRAMPAWVEVEVGEGETRVGIELSETAIEGRVTDASGAPVVGVVVGARPLQGGVGWASVVFGSGSGEAPIEARVADGATATVRTGADGSYRLHGVLPEVPISVFAEGPWIVGTTSAPLEIPRDETRRGVDLRVDAAGMVRVLLLEDEPGSIRQGWHVLVQRDGDARHEHTTRPSVEIASLRPGTWSLRVFRGDGRAEDPSVRTRQVEITPGRATEIELRVP